MANVLVDFSGSEEVVTEESFRMSRRAATKVESKVDNEFEQLVLKEMQRESARREARRRLASENVDQESLGGLQSLDEFLDEEDEDEEEWRVEGLWPIGGRVNLAAPQKSGKTTLVSNLIRSLVDGDEFLGRFETSTISNNSRFSVAVFDFEMTARQVKTWYRDQGIENSNRVAVKRFRGRAGQFNFLDPVVRAELVKLYAGAHTYILDPISPLMTALGLDEDNNSQFQNFLTQWDDFVEELGGQESMVVHHTGHNEDRARGASAFQGSGDAIWHMAKTSKADDSPKRFKAHGRDVELPYHQLIFSRDGRRLTIDERPASEKKLQSAAPTKDSVEYMAFEKCKTYLGPVLSVMQEKGFKSQNEARKWMEIHQGVRRTSTHGLMAQMEQLGLITYATGAQNRKIPQVTDKAIKYLDSKTLRWESFRDL